MTNPVYVALTSYAPRDRKVLHKALLAGEIECTVKHHGTGSRWLVHKDQADAFLAQRHKPVEHGEIDVTTPSILTIEVTMSLQRIEALLQRVVAWVERELEKE